MAYGAPGQYPPPKPPAAQRTGDVVTSVVLLVIAWLGTAIAGAGGLFVFAFTDYCPPESCSTDRAFDRLLYAAIPVAVLLVGGTAGVIAQGARSRPAWPIALVVLIGCAVGCVAGLVGAGAALGFGSASS